MKNIYLLFFGILFIYTSAVKAQYISICVEDTLVLGVQNYQYGVFQWEKSYDNENWMAIAEGRDSIMRVAPERNTFYRAQISFPDCEPIYSEVSYAQLPPDANAGFDRIVSGRQALLNANMLPGAIGEWTVISGEGATLSDTGNPNSFLTGTHEKYSLQWTLTNACGSSTDTVEIHFEETVFEENIAIVDTTDVLHSTPRQKTEGLYIIEFSEPVPQVEENTLLVGMGDGGYLRMVESVSSDGNTLSIQTRQADLEDLIISGPLNLGDVLNLEMLVSDEKANGHYQRLHRMPTRAELMNKSLFPGNTISFYPLGEKVDYRMPGTRISSLQKDASEPLVSIDMEYPALINSHGFKLQLTGNYQYSPNFVADLDYGPLGLRNLKLGTVNAAESKSMKLALEVSAGASTPKMEFSFASVTRYYLVIVGTIPVLVDVNFKIEGEFKAFAGGTMTFSHEVVETNQSNAYIQYHDRQWNYVYNKSSQSSVSSNVDVNAGLEQEFSMGPVLSFRIYSVLGPYMEYKLEEELKLCVNTEGNWHAGLDLKSNFKLGTKATILGREIVDFSRSWGRPIYNYSYPYGLEVYSGNNQLYTPGEALEFNPRVQVKANNGVALPYGRVLFRPQSDGEVSDSIVFTNAIGLAETRWIPGDSIRSELQVLVLDCDDKPIKHVPLIFVAYADTTDYCRTSSLALSVLQTDSLLSPLASLGVPPYQYAVDDSPFAADIPEIVGVPMETYTFRVRDEQECEASVSFTMPDPCVEDKMSLEVFLHGDTLTLQVSGGLPPYALSFNGSDFIENVLQIPYETGSVYQLVVKDQYDCIVTSWFAEPDVCDEYGLGFEWVITDGNVLSIDPFGGFPPYSFQLEGEEYGEEIPQVEIVGPDAFVFTVKDEIECSFSAVFDPCEEFGLNLEVIREDELVSVQAGGGVPPYEYSVNGEDFSPTIPQVTPQMGETYWFYVMDQLGCMAEVDYNLCYDSGLSLQLTVVGEKVTAEASGGTPPYLFSLNDTLNWSSQHEFSNLSVGTHMVFVKDANGCLGQAEVQKLDCGPDGLMVGSQCWMRENLNIETEMSFCYNDDPARCDAYGRLYSWEAAMEACPVGWRLPSRADYEQMVEYLVAAGYGEEWDEETSNPYPNLLAKSLASKVPWQSTSYHYAPGNNPFVNNSSGFNGFPAGMGGWDEINNDPEVRVYIEYRRMAVWWTSSTSTDEEYDAVSIFMLNYDNPFTSISSAGREGPLMPIRCIKN